MSKSLDVTLTLPCYFFNAAGGTVADGGTLGNRFLFTGREWLKDIGLYDYRNRLYHPLLGRFMQPDPKQFGAGDYNLYRYAHNDPVNKNDPFGMDPVVVSPEANLLALEADSRNLNATNGNTYVFGLLAFEFSTTVYRDTQNNLSLSETRTDYHQRDVTAPENTKLTSVVETHSHIFDGNDGTTHSALSAPDVKRGNQNGRTQEVITPNGTRDRYRPSDSSAERREGTGGIIERRDSNGAFERLDGANTNLKNYLDHRN